jgi:hypothetical protein
MLQSDHMQPYTACGTWSIFGKTPATRPRLFALLSANTNATVIGGSMHWCVQ